MHKVKFWALTSLLLTVLACAHHNEGPLFVTAPVQMNTAASNSAPVAMLVHGLNTRPDKMKALADVLTSMGYVTQITQLSGDANQADWPAVSLSIWHQEMLQAYRDLVTNRQPRQILFVGFSLGAALGTELLSSEASVHFDKMILLAPAISVHGYTRLVRIFGFWGSLSIPSASPAEYRQHSGTSEDAYGALFDAIDNLSVLQTSQQDKLSVPTLVMTDPDDELVSQVGLKDWVQTNQLRHWDLQSVSNQGSTLTRPYHHLIIDAVCVGEAEWLRMKTQIGKFLNP